MSNDNGLSRREMLDMALCAAALPSGKAFFAKWFSREPERLEDYQPKFFSPEDFAALQAFTEILIPTDDTPGAREAKCAHFIDFVLSNSSEVPQSQANWKEAMQALNAAGFHSAAANRRLELVTEMAKPETDRDAKHPAFFAYRLIKQQNTFAFYTSKAGMIETLDYKGNSYNISFPPCNHPEHQTV